MVAADVVHKYGTRRWTPALLTCVIFVYGARTV